MRLVDADAFKAEGRELYRDAGWDLRDVHYSQLDTECNIDMMPTIEAEPIKHGRWEQYLDEGLKWKCSKCGSRFATPWHYCPNCSARMDEVEE